MNREVFQPSKVMVIGILFVILIAFSVASVQMELPIWVFPAIVVLAGLIVLSAIKTKIVVENGLIRYEKLIGGEEIELKRVAQIVTREVETIVNKNQEELRMESRDVAVGNVRINNNHHNVDQERKIERIIYVLDKEGRTFFSFPANMIRLKDRSRCKESVQASNPNIDIG